MRNLMKLTKQVNNMIYLFFVKVFLFLYYFILYNWHYFLYK